MLHIHCFQHVPFENLGSIDEWIRKKNHRLTTTHFYSGETPPDMDSVDWLIILGGPMNVDEHETYPWLITEKKWIQSAIDASKTVLGICLGAQLIAQTLGSKVAKNAYKEIGWFPIRMHEEALETQLFTSFPPILEVFHWHGDTFDCPPGARNIAESAACKNQAFLYRGKILGLQFHLESTPEGIGQLLARCADELGPGPFIQKREDILAKNKDLPIINSIMHELLDQLEQATLASKQPGSSAR